MILEVAMLQVRPGQGAEFERAFERARTIIASMPGHVSHQLQRCLEVEEVAFVAAMFHPSLTCVAQHSSHAFLGNWRTIE